MEELRLSRAMAYVSISPSSVGEDAELQTEHVSALLLSHPVCVPAGGCLSLEEVRSKQQQEMMRAKRKQKAV